MKTAVVYYSQHHGNTKKLVDALPEDVARLEAGKGEKPDLSAFDRIGLASGIYGGAFARQVMDWIKNDLPAGKDVFLFATSAMKRSGPFKAVRRACEEKKCRVLGEYVCQGYNTFGPFKLVGGTAKGHPTQEEIDAFRAFYDSLG